MYIPHDDGHYYPFLQIKLLISKFVHCLFKTANQDLPKVPKVFFMPTTDRAYL